jgi:2',3'-cyclic-nucleotide 2'-phosphodiesterase/3'-nucleotidase
MTAERQVILGHPFELVAGSRQAQLRLLATTDLHFRLLGWDYLSDRASPDTGLARAAALIRRLRLAVPNSLLFDNGDFLQGSPLSDVVADGHDRGEDGIHPMIAAMNALGYDAATLGNHEFNYGLPYLTSALSNVAFPIVSANVLKRDGTPLVQPVVMLDRMLGNARGEAFPIRIGVIGLAPPQIARWDRIVLGGDISTRDIVETAAEMVPSLRAAGADIVVALAHSGIGHETAVPGMENAAVPLAALQGIDAVIAGHTHQVFPGPGFTASTAVDPAAGTVHGKPVVMAGFHGRHVGLIDLHLEHDGTSWKTIAHATRAVPVAAVDDQSAGSDPQIDALAAAPHRRFVSDMRRRVGWTDTPIRSYFVLVAPDPGLQVVADAQRARAQVLLSGLPEAKMPLLSAVAPFHAGGRAGCGAYVDIPRGPLRRRHASELYSYPNRLCIIALTGAQIADWLEFSAGLFCRLVPGVVEQPLIEPSFPSYLFDVIDGLSYTIDPTAAPRYDPHGNLIDPAATRICDLSLEGCPLDPERIVLVATNSYRAGGGGGAPVLRDARIVCSDARGVRDAVLDHMASQSPLSPVARQTWRFAAGAGTAAWFDTAPAALDHVLPSGVVPIGPAPEGFHRFRIALDLDGNRHGRASAPYTGQFADSAPLP